jgi:hypothetical protein
MSMPQICRELRVFSATLRRLLADFPTTLERVGDKFVQPKLHEQWKELNAFIESKRLAGIKGNAVRWHSDRSAFAVASASASAQSKDNPALNHSDFYRRNRKDEERTREVSYGSGPSDSGNLGGFKVLTCEACGEKFRSRQTHARECKAKPVEAKATA